MANSAADPLRQIEATLRALADPAQAAPMQAYMLNQFVFLGIRAVPRRAALKVLPKLALPAAELLALAEALWQLPEREFRYTAVDLLAKQHQRLDASALPRLLQLVQRDAWWDTADGWLTDPNLWVRRVAMLHQLGWREQTDAKRLFRYALALSAEKEFFIRKAIGWALRDHARTQPEAVRAFLAQQGHRFSGLTVREAGKHL